jgi:hypothetical protein
VSFPFPRLDVYQVGVKGRSDRPGPLPQKKGGIIMIFNFTLREMIYRNITDDREEAEQLIKNINYDLNNYISVNDIELIKNRIIEIIEQCDYDLEEFIFTIAQIIDSAPISPSYLKEIKTEGEYKDPHSVYYEGFELDEDWKFCTEYTILPSRPRQINAEIVIADLGNPGDGGFDDSIPEAKESIMINSLEQLFANDCTPRKELAGDILIDTLKSFARVIAIVEEDVTTTNKYLNEELLRNIKSSVFVNENSDTIYRYLPRDTRENIDRNKNILKRLRVILNPTP